QRSILGCHCLADFLRHRILARLRFLQTCQMAAAGFVLGDKVVDNRSRGLHRLAALDERVCESLGVFTDPTDVEHGFLSSNSRKMASEGVNRKWLRSKRL